MHKKRLLIKFREFLVQKSTLRDIENYFESFEFERGERDESIEGLGMRRGLIQQYYNLIDIEDNEAYWKLLNLFGEILVDLKSNFESWPSASDKRHYDVLLQSLEKANLKFDGKNIVSLVASDLHQIKNASISIDTKQFNEYINRIKESIETDPKLAIGSSKELVESVLKNILVKMNVSYNKNDDIPKLLRAAQRALNLVPSEVNESIKGKDIIKTLLSNLGQMVIKIAELRNLYGTGHGKESSLGLEPRHARLTVNSTIALCTFLLETLDDSIT